MTPTTEHESEDRPTNGSDASLRARIAEISLSVALLQRQVGALSAELAQLRNRVLIGVVIAEVIATVFGRFL